MLLMLGQQAIAQTEDVNDHMEIEIDPIAYAMHGFSLHGIYNINRFRLDFGAYGIEYPGELKGNNGYSTMTRGLGIKGNYLIKSIKGMYAGVDCGFAANNVTARESMKNDMGHSISMGIHAGYRIFLFPKQPGFLSGLYVTPWAGVSYDHIIDKVKFSGYKQNNIGYFATFHIGYRL